MPYKDKAAQKQNDRKYREKNREKQLWKAAKRRAEKFGLCFDIELSDIIIPEVCPILGITLIVNRDYSKQDSITLDRVDNTQGYVKGNIQVISNLANSMKSCATPEFIIKFAKWALANYSG